MRLASVKRHWERLARRDPYWAVLTNLGTGPDAWDLREFFQSGTEEVAGLLRRATQLGLTVPRRRALDFGCGVGRVTQALAVEFEHCDGVDISASMLQVARQHNRHPDRCSYHRNLAPHLAIFPDESFSLVYSTLVLQHMDPRDSTGCIRELMRVLARDGVLVFQLPSHRAAQEPAVDAERTSVHGRLPLDAHRARLSIEVRDLSALAGELVTLEVVVENRSDYVWPALPDTWGRYQILLANHWLTETGVVVQRDDGRCPLPHDLAPNARVELMLGVTAPRFDGRYMLELDLVQEDVAWFSQRGSSTLRIPCTVTGGLAGGPPMGEPEVVEPREIHPFRERYPRIFTVLRVSGLREVYWTWRRGLDLIKSRRDQAIRRVIHPVIERLIHPIVNWWSRRPFAARMEMHCVPRSVVLSILSERGGHVLALEEELMPGGLHSCRYWVTKYAPTAR